MDRGLLDTIYGIAAVCGAVATIVTAVVLVAKGVKWVQGRYERSRKGLYAAFNRLGPGVHLEHFNTVLGMTPRVRSSKTHLYVHKWFYLQVATDDNDRVWMFAVTTQSEDFNPPVWGRYSLQPNESLYLGKATYEECIPEEWHTGVTAWLSAQHFYYMESISSGNWNSYLTLAIGFNDAGKIFKDGQNESERNWDWKDVFPDGSRTPNGRLVPRVLRYDDEDDEPEEEEPSKEPGRHVRDYFAEESVRRWRRNAIPNTYAVFGPLRLPAELSQIGPDRDDIRTMPA
jgi:hypothetical protein